MDAYMVPTRLPIYAAWYDMISNTRTDRNDSASHVK